MSAGNQNVLHTLFIQPALVLQDDSFFFLSFLRFSSKVKLAQGECNKKKIIIKKK